MSRNSSGLTPYRAYYAVTTKIYRSRNSSGLIPVVFTDANDKGIYKSRNSSGLTPLAEDFYDDFGSTGVEIQVVLRHCYRY